MGKPAAGPTSDGKLRFGVFAFDPQARELFKSGTRLKVQAQPLEILETLLTPPGEIVSREQLQQRLWPDGTFVDFEQSLNKAVNKLREALGDSADAPVYIETLPRRGYRFVAPVTRDTVAPPGPPTIRRRLWPWLAAGATLLAVVLGTGLWPIEVPRVLQVEQLTKDRSTKTRPLLVEGATIYYADGKILWSLRTSGGEPQRVSVPLPSPFDFMYARSIAQQQILLITGPSPGGAVEWWLFGTGGGTLRKLGEMKDANAAISPDGQRIAIASKDGIYVQSIAKGTRKRLRPRNASAGTSVWWHPAGDTIGFFERQADGQTPRVWQVNADRQRRGSSDLATSHVQVGQFEFRFANIDVDCGDTLIGARHVRLPGRMTSTPTTISALQ